jgi:hypothetical protein
MSRIPHIICAFALVATLLPHAAVAGTGCVAFDTAVEFRDWNLAQGKVLKGIEDFEESNIEPTGKQPLPAPFEPGTPNTFPPDDPLGIGFPNGLSEDNITIWDNITPGPSPPALNPSGDDAALYVIGQGFIGANSIKVGEDLEVLGIVEDASIDIVFPIADNHTAVGFTLSRFAQFPTGGWVITIYDETDTILGTFDVPAPPGPEPDKSFFGVWCDQAIGRINIWDASPDPAPEAIDDVQMWFPLTVPTESASWGSIKATYDSE